MAREQTDDWQPGDLAVATVHTPASVRVTRTFGTPRTGQPVDGWYTYRHGHVTDLRRLYVLDLGGQDPRSIVSALREASLDDTADQIEAQLPPAVPEPTGLGAVVLARTDPQAEASEWVRYSRKDPWWRATNAEYAKWSDLISPAVLSEGVI